MKSYTISYSGLLNYKSTYEDLFRELKRNLTKQLDTVGPSGGNTRYTYSFVFSGPQIDALKKQLESELKLQLQNEISTATNNGNLNQQINQQTSNIGLHHNSDFSDQITQQKSNSEITQQQQNGSENLELGGQSQTTDAQPEDLTQQIGYDQTSHQQREFGQRLSHGAHLGGSSSGRLQLGTQHVEQQSSYDQSDVTQQVESNPFENSQLRGQQQIDAQSTNQFQQVEEVNPQLTQAQLNLPGKLQFGNKLINQKPIDSSNFINTEIDRQQHLYPHQDIISQQNKPNNKPNRLPTLNQVIQQQQSIPDSEEPNTQYPIEPQIPLSNLYQQQTEDKQQQKQDIDLYQQSQNSIYQIGEHAELGAEQNQDGQSASGHGFATNTPLTYTQILRQGSQAHTGLVSGTFQTNPFDRGQNSFDTYLNKQQIQLAHQLENELSRQLQDVISQNYYTITHSTGAERQEFLKALQTNITKQLEQILNGAGYSTHLYYGSGLTQEQKDKLKNELQASLSRQIQHDLQISYHIQQQNNGQQNAFDSRVTSESTAPHGSGIRGIYNIYGSNLNTQETEHTNQLHYGQQEVVPDSETASELHPLRPEQATVVQNVESNYNTGIKGPKRPGVTFESNSVVNAEIHYPQSEPTTQSVVQSSEPQEIADLNETPQENLPWWKRVGKKIKQGATSLKEKIIG